MNRWIDPTGDDTIRTQVAGVRRAIPGALDLAVDIGADLPVAGSPHTLRLWDQLARSASVDLTVTRAIEPHLDALGILHQAGVDAPPGATLGVYAAEGAGVRLTATGQCSSEWLLTGTKAWCSLATELTHALVTAWIDDQRRGLFLVSLRQDGVRAEDAPWVASGLSLIPSGPVTFNSVPAIAIGGPQWYLSRPGFAWGGIGVAAIWYGAAVGIADRMRVAAANRPPDDVALMHLGACDSTLSGARAVLREAAQAVAGGTIPEGQEWPYAVRVRDVCARAAEAVLRHADHSMGPAPLTSDEPYARLVDDLRVYLRQHHAERDQIALGRAVLELG